MRSQMRRGSDVHVADYRGYQHHSTRLPAQSGGPSRCCGIRAIARQLLPVLRYPRTFESCSTLSLPGFRVKSLYTPKVRTYPELFRNSRCESAISRTSCWKRTSINRCIQFLLLSPLIGELWFGIGILTFQGVRRLLVSLASLDP